MPTDDEISERVLEGDTYRRAEVTVNRAFSISLDGKLRITVGALAASLLFAPALFLRRDLIRMIEETGSLSETLSPSLATMALLGILQLIAAGVLLVRQEHLRQQGSPDMERARRMVRFEDLLMWFVLVGAAFVGIPTVLAAVGLVSPDAVGALYDRGVRVYRPSGALGPDARLVSIAGGVSALILYAVWQAVEATAPR